MSRSRLFFWYSFFLYVLISGVLSPILCAAELPGKSDEPIHLKADQLEYLKETDLYIAQGDAEVVQGSMRLTADTLRLDGKTGKLLGLGHIHYFDGENTIEAERIEVNVDTKLGIIYNGKIFLKAENYYIEGEEIIRHTLDHYELKTSAFTACDCQENPAWRIRASTLDLTVDEYLSAKNARFYVKEVPVFYFPFFLYPAKQDRHTGLLVPNIGYSSKYGFRYKQGLFFALAAYQDATITAEHRGDKGDGLALQYRYILSNTSRGELNAEFFQDKEDNVDRWEIRFNHEQQFTSRVQGKLDLKYVNQTSNLRALSDRTADRAQQNIESNLSLTYQGDNTYAYFLARYTQDLTQANNNNTPQRLPEIGFSLIEYRLGDAPVYFNADSTAVNFWSKSGLDLQRIDVYPKLSLPLRLGNGGTFTPWAGFRETWYSQGDQKKDDAISRVTVPVGITLEGRTSATWGETTHQSSAALFYEKIDVSDGEDLIQIDELDGIHNRENITATVIQRLLKRNHQGLPEEKASFRLTESYHVDKIAAGSRDTRRFSDVRAELHLRPSPSLSLEVDTFYDIYDDKLTSLNSDLGLGMTPYLNLKGGYRSTRDGTVPKKGDLFNPYYLGDRETTTPKTDFITGEATISTPWGIRYTNKVFYDIEQSKMVEIDHLVHYQAQCWGLGLSYIEFHDRTEFSFVVTLKGLGAFGPEQ